MPGRYVLRELLLEPEFVTADTKVSHLPGSSTPSNHSPVITVNREPKMGFVEVPQDVFPILEPRPCLRGAE